MNKQLNIYSMRSIAVGGALGLILTACGTNPVQQAQTQQGQR